MKQFKLTFLLTILMSMVGTKAFAYDIAVKNADGQTIYYNYTNEGLELEVTYLIYDYGDNKSAYRDIIVIPDEVTYMNRTRKVTSINEYAFMNCSGMTSVTIPSSVTSIGDYAFSGCSGLKKVIVKDIAAWCKIDFVVVYSGNGDNITNPLYYAGHLYSDENTEITNLVIPNSVTSIGDNAFRGCSGLASVTIPNSVTDIGYYAFYDCSGLKKVIVKDIAAWCNIKFGYNANPLSYAYHLYSDENTEITDLVIPNSVTSIGETAFFRCSGLTSVTIPNSVTSIGNYAFSGCSGLTSITIGNSVTSIGGDAFSGCSGLTSVTIPNSVTSIGSGAFNSDNLATVVSMIEKPFVINVKSSMNPVFSQNTFMNGTLYVPTGTKDTYKATGGWKDFLFIEEGTGGGEPVTPETKKCEKPSISYQNGKLTFSSETEGATCVSSITDEDMGTYTTNEVQLGVTYNISVYAAKAGYENSETVTATLCWIDQEPKTEGITDGIANVPANAVMIQSEAGVLSVQGADDGTQVSAYAINGTQIGSVISQNGRAVINTNLKAGSIAVVKIGNRSVKVIVK